MPSNRPRIVLAVLFGVAQLLVGAYSFAASAEQIAIPRSVSTRPAETPTADSSRPHVTGHAPPEFHLPIVMKAYTGSRITITEVMPKAAPGGAEWIELHNPSSEPVGIGGYHVTDHDGSPYAIPGELPPVPGGAYVLVMFDGAGSGSNDYDFGDNVATLHTPPGHVDIFEDDVDQVAVYEGPARNGDTIVAFVAWGGEAGDDANQAIEVGMWAAEWYVSFARGGDYSEEDLLVPDESMGLYPGSEAQLLHDWVIYRERELTPGAANPVPMPAWYTPTDEAVVDPDGFAVAWSMIPNATGYRFQLDDDRGFGSPLVNMTLSEPFYAPSSPVPEGTYYWRAQTIGAEGQRSAWTGAVQIGVEAVPPIPGTALGTPSPQTAISFGCLWITWQRQHKDTRMLCLDGCPEAGNGRWDSSHELDGDWTVGNGVPVIANSHDQWYCVRASISMMASYYGCTLSQDRISYYSFGARDPEGDLGHGKGYEAPPHPMETAALAWALRGVVVPAVAGKPTFASIKGWIDADRPIMARRAGHMRVIDGYYEFDVLGFTRRKVHVLDPATGPSWEEYAPFPILHYWVGPVPPVPPAAPACISDEDFDGDATADTIDDSDGDGMCDFDERIRFNTNPLWRDSDNDCVEEKKDVRGYVFTNAGVWIPRGADCDGDGLRKERDRDNDNGGRIDGDEDANRNGKAIDVLWARDGADTNNFSMPLLGFTDDALAPSRCGVPATPTPTRTPTLMPTPTRTVTRTPTRTRTPTPTPTRAPSGTLPGTIVCATTGTGIGGARVAVQGTGLSTTTDASGEWSISNVPVGEQTLEVSAQGYAAATQPVNVVAGANPPITIALASVSGDVMIVLTWGEQPADLDAHAGGRDIQNLGDTDGRFHSHYLDRTPVTYAGLDHDDTTSYGPETLVIRPDPGTDSWVDCTYTYWVHNFSGTPGFAGSGAVVTVYQGGAQIAQYAVESEPGVGAAGNLWRVCDLTLDTQGQVTIDRSVRGFHSGSRQAVFCPGPGGPQSECPCERLYADDFSDPGSGWPQQTYADVTAGYDQGNYRIVIDRDYWAAWVWPDFRCEGCSTEVTAWRAGGQGSSYGVVFGVVDNNNFYLFRTDPARREYALVRKQSGAWEVLIPVTGSNHIRGGEAHNRLKVTREGSMIKLYVNGQHLGGYTDSTFTGSRRVGLYAESEGHHPVTLRYDDFTVWRLGSTASADASGVAGIGASATAGR